MTDSPMLFEPMRFRDLTLQNRIWLAPMCQYSVPEEDGVPTDWHLVHLGSRAAGGYGLIMTEASAVVPEGRISLQDAGIWNDRQATAWQRIVEFIHSQGSAAGVQLAHAGRKASAHRGFPGEKVGPLTESEGAWQTVGPSEVPFEGMPAPRALTVEELRGVVDAFGEAAGRADAAGFDLVEIHAAHGYLLHEFLSPLSNVRTDEYGGDFGGRTRLLREVVAGVRAALPAEKPLFVRLSGTDWTDGGWDIEQTVHLARVLAELGVDLIDMSSGGNVVAHIPVGPEYQVPLARAVRKDGVVAVSAVGLIDDPAQAEAILQRGDADAIFIARAALREPAWPLRAAAELGVPWRDAPYPPQYTRGKWADE